MIGLLIFLLGVVLSVTLRYGYHHKNKYIQIYSMCLFVWLGFIYLASYEFYGLIPLELRFPEWLNVLCLILPLTPLWFFYKYSPSEIERRAKEEQEYRDRMGIGKTDEEHWEYLIKKGVVTPEYYRRWKIKEGIPLTEAEKRQIALEEEQRKKEAEKRKKELMEKAEKLVKGLTDRELIDKYIEWDMEIDIGVAEPDQAGEWKAINTELKRRKISSRGIELRKKELGLSTLVKCRDCKRLNVCQIRVSTEDPNVEIECSEYKEKEK